MISISGFVVSDHAHDNPTAMPTSGPSVSVRAVDVHRHVEDISGCDAVGIFHTRSQPATTSILAQWTYSLTLTVTVFNCLPAVLCPSHTFSLKTVRAGNTVCFGSSSTNGYVIPSLIALHTA